MWTFETIIYCLVFARLLIIKSVGHTLSLPVQRSLNYIRIPDIIRIAYFLSFNFSTLNNCEYAVNHVALHFLVVIATVASLVVTTALVLVHLGYLHGETTRVLLQ
jgi:hypothetical protein